MKFKFWLESVWLHGTPRGDEIRQSGKFTVSTSGGGQRGLLGVWVTKDRTYADVWANSIQEKPGRPEILQVEIPDNLNIADLNAIEQAAGNHLDAQRALWKFVGFDIDSDDPEHLEPLRQLQPYAMTKLLIEMGYDGALIPNTVHKDGEPELCIFDPKHVTLIPNTSPSQPRSAP